MPGDRTIMPNPARVRRGWRAGVRAQSQWLDTVAGLAAVGLVLGAIPWSMASGFGARWQAAIAEPGGASAVLVEVVWAAVALGAALAVGYGVARFLSAAFAGRVGPLERRGLRRLGVAPSGSQGAVVLVVLGALAGGAMLLAVRGVLAGASRAVDASAAGTWQLWTAWPQRTWAAVLVVLSVVGWAELLLSQRRNRIRLAQTPGQVRDDLRARGGRR